jgi:hypothetical protein
MSFQQLRGNFSGTSFLFFDSISFQFHIIPPGKKVVTLSPQRVITYSHIPSQATHLVLIWKKKWLKSILSKIFNHKLPITLIELI